MRAFPAMLSEGCCDIRSVPRALVLILALVLSSASCAGAARPESGGQGAAPVLAAGSDTPTSQPDQSESPGAPAPSESNEPTPFPLEVVTAGLPQGRTRHQYHATLAAVGGTAPSAWALTSGALPPGLMLSPSGAISGTPTKDGAYTLTVQVTDAEGATATKLFELEIILPTLAITTPSLLAGRFGHAYSATLRATDGTPGYTWSTTRGSLPTGLRLAGSGRITGSPSRVGAWSFTVKVTDSKGKYATRGLRIATSASLDAVASTVRASFLGYTYRPGCPVPPSKLRRIVLNQWGFQGQPYRGELIVRGCPGSRRN